MLMLLLFSALAFGCDTENEISENQEPIELEESEIDVGPEYGGELIVPLTRVNTLNPLVTTDRNLYYFNKLMFESLFELDDTYKISPVLAKGYSIESGGQEVKIELRDDVFWHDGVKFTASDVKFTLDAIKYGGGSSIFREMIQKAYGASNSIELQNLVNIQVLDDYNIKVIFNGTYGNALEGLTFPIIPMHKFTQSNKIDKLAYEKAMSPDNFTPIGTGPYKLVSFEKLKSVTIEANENWWKGKPYISTIEGRILADDKLGEIAYSAGQIDLALPTSFDWDKFTQKERVRIYEFVSQNYEFLGANQNSRVFQGNKGNALRKAIAYGIDRQAIIQRVYLGHGTQIDVPIFPESWLLSDSAHTFGYNVEMAKKVLEDAGYRMNNNGIYEDEEGNKLSIRFTTNSYNELRRNTANMIADNLNNIGIEVIKEYKDTKTDNLTQELIDEQWESLRGRMAAGNYDLVLLGWELSVIPDLDFAFHSSQIATGNNFINYQSETMDLLISQAFRANNDQRRKSLYDNIQREIIKDLPYISLFFTNNALLLDRKVRGDINPLPHNIYYNIETWYIPKHYQGQN